MTTSTEHHAVSDSLIAYQGEPGANSHLACLEACPDRTPQACNTFDDAFAAVTSGRAALAMIPIDNSVAGRVADIHRLMQVSELFIVGEHFRRITHHLMAIPGTPVGELRRVASHIHALGQCRRIVAELGLEPVPVADTAGAAAAVARSGDRSTAAIASAEAAEIHGLEVLRSGIEDDEHNTTRFVLLSAQPSDPPPDGTAAITSLLFPVRNVPAALFKALGGFATNGVNMTKLESYVDGSFNVAEFHVDVEGRPTDRNVRLALDELGFFTSSLRILGVYASAPARRDLASRPRDSAPT
ncbi:prephenate dehydratase [Ilumatobacter sp.]|uniref:prephenate dehydratase n=1 Tax=Ilumatobacter sp. TaxID=1967498 RepID=UPI003B52723B